MKRSEASKGFGVRKWCLSLGPRRTYRCTRSCWEHKAQAHRLREWMRQQLLEPFLRYHNISDGTEALLRYTSQLYVVQPWTPRFSQR